MCDKRGKMCQIESVRLSINEQLTSVGEEIFCALEKQRGDVCETLFRAAVLERLSAAAEFMCNLFQREIETLETLLKRENKLLHVMLQPHIKLHRAEVSPEHEKRSPSLVQEEPQPPQIKEEQEEEADVSTLTLLHRNTSCGTLSDFLHLPVCREEISVEQQERNPSLIQEEPEALQIKEEQQELLQRPEEAAGSTLTLLAVKHEDDDVNIETEPLASTSIEHMKTQADVEDCGTSQSTSDGQLLSSHCSESDTEDSDEWKETREDQSGLNTLKSHKTRNVEGQRSSLSNKVSQDLQSSEQTLPMRIHTGQKSFNCTECGKGFGRMSSLKRHMVTHTGEKPFPCEVCAKGFAHMGDLKKHMRTHTGEKPFTCTVCEQRFSLNQHLTRHMRTHTDDKKQRQSSSDGDPDKKKSRTTTSELQGVPSDKDHSLLGVKGDNKSKKKRAGRPKGSKSK